MIKFFPFLWSILYIFASPLAASEQFLNVQETEFVHSLLKKTKFQVNNQIIIMKKIKFENEKTTSKNTLYQLKTDRGNFILKEIGLNPERQINAFKIIRQTFESYQAPTLALSLAIFSVGTVTDKRFFGLFPEAPGDSLNTIFNNYMMNTLDGSFLKECFSAVGHSIASLHLKGIQDKTITFFEEFKTRFIHGKLHDKNIFFKAPVSLCLINLGEMVKSIDKPQFPNEDLITLLLESLGFPVLFYKSALVSTQQKNGIETAINAFLNAYGSHFNHFQGTNLVLEKILRQAAYFTYQEMINDAIHVISEEEKEEIITRLMNEK